MPPQETVFGKRAKPESYQAVRLGEAEESCHVQELSKEQRGITEVKIWGETYPALLDNGSKVCIVGDKLIKMINEKKLPKIEEKKRINGLFAGSVLTHSIELDVEFHGKTTKVKGILAPGALDYIILGTDFMKEAEIILMPPINAYKIGLESTEYFPHKTFDGAFMSSSYMLELEAPSIVNDWKLDDFTFLIEEEATAQGDIPASVLHNWASEFNEWLQDDEEVEDNLENLFPDKANFLQVPIELEERKKEKLREILLPFLDMFTPKPGHCSLYKHHIELIQGAKPFQDKYIPMSKGKREAFDETFNQLIDYDIIEPSTSPWAANAFVKLKPDGDYRFLVNYKGLNTLTVADSYPIPCIDQILSYLGPANYYSSADASKGFFQIEIDEESRPLTAFRSHRGLYQFKRLPQGLQNSPFTYQKCVDTILGDALFIYSFCFFDDCINFSETFEEHCLHLTVILSRFKDAGFTFNPKKVQICRRRLKYLGFIIEPGKISPDPAKVIKIRHYPRPFNITDIRRFLGALSYYRRFIPSFSLYALPLYKLTSPYAEFFWTPECQSGFEGLKTALADFTQVYLPDLNREFIITTDASRKAIAAVLSQEKDGVRYPVYFASRTLRPAESKGYSVTELELAAILFGIGKFRQYIELTHFTIETDHRAISFLQNLKDPSGKLAKWYLILQSFKFTIRYRPGTSAVLRTADALSRVTESLLIEDNENITRTELIQEQDKDPFLSKIKQTLLGTYSNKNTDSRMFSSIAKRSVMVDDGLLLRFTGSRDKLWESEDLYYRVWIPQSLRKDIISIFHSTDLAAHLGRHKTFAKLEQGVYWKGMSKDVHEYVSKCEKCVTSRMPHIPPVPGRTMEPEAPWETISLDLIGPFAKSTKQNRTILVIVDNFTKWVEMFALREAKTRNILDCIKKVFLKFGFCKTVISDNGTQFASRAYHDYLTSVGIKPYFIPPYHPQVNITERYNQTIKSKIRATMEKVNDWDRCIDEIAFALRSSVNETTGFTPAYLMFGREFRYPFDNLVNVELSKVKETKELQQRMLLIHDIARQNIIERTHKALEKKNLKSKDRTLELGNTVWCRTHILSCAEKGISSSLMPKLEGPYEVINKHSDHIFDLKHTVTGQHNFRVHINDLVITK